MRTTIHALGARSIEPSEFPAFFRTTCTAFGEEARDATMRAEQPAVEFDRTLAAFDHDQIVATSATMTMDVTVPGGGRLPLGGLTWVGTLPGYTRRGLLTGLIDAQLRDMRERGEPLGGLWASEGGIYGRFGFGAATWGTALRLERSWARLKPEGAEVSAPARGLTSLLPGEQCASVLPALYDAHARTDIGSLRRPDGWWTAYLADVEEHREGGGPRYVAVHRDAEDRAQGYVCYRIAQKWDQGIPRNTLRVEELVAGSAHSARALWTFCFDVDLVDAITTSLRPVDEPLRWMLRDPRRLETIRMSDGLWLRLLDVPQALTSRSYAAPGTLVLQVEDAFGGFARGRYLLETGEGGASCSRTRRSPHVRLDAATLASLYLGGASFSALHAGGRIEEVQEGAATRADALFTVPRAPYCATEF